MAWLVVTVILLISYAVLIRFYYRHFKALPLFSAAGYEPQIFVSVIVAARNEEKTLPHLLKALENQTYPKEHFEIIIVDDFSTDNTAAVVQNFSKPHLRMTSFKKMSSVSITVIQPNTDVAQSSKKKAIEAGVQQAKGTLLLITDADCVPSRDWIKTAAAFYEQNGVVFIAAPVRFSHNNSLLQIFQALDFMTLQGITAASVAARFHSMCNGANLAYTKEVFHAVNGFAGIDHIASGDDMLLMHKIWKQNKAGVQYLKSCDAVVTTDPMQSWAAFFAQRKRWASKTPYYDDKRVLFVLLFILFFNCWFFILLSATFSNAHTGLIAVGFLILKTTIEWPFVAMVSKFYSDEKLMRYFFFLQPLHIFYTVSVGVISQFGRYEWKGRRTK